MGESPCSQWPRTEKVVVGKLPACMARATSGRKIAGASGDDDVGQEVGTRGGGNEE